MKNMYNKGFTLVEIMVVIVIMGILAAIAVPKLFGNIARAKASEIAPAASIYQKLQDVYHGAHGTIGNWSAIGYIAPGGGKTTNFTYCSGDITENIADDKFGEAAKIGWQASNNTSLNGCTAGQWWFVSVTPESGSNILYTNETSAAECVALAKPNWTVSSRTGMSCGEAGSVAETTNLLAGVNVFANGAVTVERGGWNGDGMRSNGMVNKDSSSTTSVYNSVLYTYNTGETEPGKEGLFKLEPNSTYTFTFSDPENEWTSKDGFLQADIRVFTNLEKQEAATIMCGTTTKSDAAIKADYEKNKQWATTGENTSSKSKEGFDAVGTYDPVTKTTTFTITTGNEASYFGANFRKNGGNGFATSSDAQRQAAQTAIENASLVKTGSSDGSKTAAQIAAENKEKEEEKSSK